MKRAETQFRTQARFEECSKNLERRLPHYMTTDNKVSCSTPHHAGNLLEKPIDPSPLGGSNPDSDSVGSSVEQEGNRSAGKGQYQPEDYTYQAGCERNWFTWPSDLACSRRGVKA